MVKGCKPLTVFAKNSIGDVQLGCKYTSDIQTYERINSKLTHSSEEVARFVTFISYTLVFLSVSIFLDL